MERVRLRAGDVGQRPVDGADDVGQRDLVGRSCQQVAAVDTAAAFDNAGVAQVAENVLEEAQGDALRGRDRLPLYGVVTVEGGELDGGSKRVVGLG